MKYIEFGFGNSWLLRTEIEIADGTEHEQRGILGPLKPRSAYIRIWIRRTVFILDTREGFKRIRKGRNAFKVIVGISSL